MGKQRLGDGGESLLSRKEGTRSRRPGSDIGPNGAEASSTGVLDDFIDVLETQSKTLARKPHHCGKVAAATSC